ncbi:class E sortase [Nocardioides cynanchi]|uniref:class E sortase n=1 Tax=Nocardioides cynanchi TaxID=2558918 RepID=UPI0012486617|nr:class E sortase [Nocardioides cynanchi]
MSTPTLVPAPAGTARPAPPSSRPPRQIRAGEPAETLYLVSSACTVLVIVSLWMLLQMLVLSGLGESRAQHLLYNQYRTQLATETAPTGALDFDGKPVAEGSPVALMSIPDLGLHDLVVVDGTASGDLLVGPGHVRSTPLPGNAGTSVVMGRRTTYGAPFAKIADLQPGAPIDVVGAQGPVTYTVTDVRRAGDPIPPLPTGKAPARLVLVTADSSGTLSLLHPHRVVYVDADVKKAHPSGPVFPAVGNAELPMQHDTSGLPLLVLLLALVAALVVAVSAARRHLRDALVWLVAAPVAIALAWAVTDQVMRLLPNLM